MPTSDCMFKTTVETNSLNIAKSPSVSNSDARPSAKSQHSSSNSIPGQLSHRSAITD